MGVDEGEDMGEEDVEGERVCVRGVGGEEPLGGREVYDEREVGGLVHDGDSCARADLELGGQSASRVMLT